MKKYLRHICILFFTFFSFAVLAQSKKEQERVEQAKKIELEAEEFVKNNFDKYKLKEEFLDEIKSHLKNENAFAEGKFKETVIALKKSELKELFYKKHPEKRKYFIPNSFDNTQEKAILCTNGGFENNSQILANYSFGTRQGNVNGCDTAPATPNAVTLATNDFNSNTSRINRGNANFSQFDPTLNSATYGNVQVPTISPNGGNSCVKLNGNNGGTDVTSMSRQFTIGADDDFIEYEFSLFLQDSDHDVSQRPTFRVDLVVAGSVVNTKCYRASPNCLYNVAFDNFEQISNGKEIYYTGWRCDRIDVGSFRGRNVTLRFTITDCAFTAHYGTVYIDNVCGVNCDAPATGTLQIEPLGGCDGFSNGIYQVCGTFIPPINGTLDNLNLSYSHNLGAFIPSGIIPTISGNNYCFDLPIGIFGGTLTGTYQFQVTANYTEACALDNFPMQNTTLASVTFNNCCPIFLNITGITSNNLPNNNSLRQAIQFINATNRIGLGNNFLGDGVVYHAGNFVELNPGFEALAGAQFAAYIAGCPDGFVYKVNDTAGVHSQDEVAVESNLVPVEESLSEFSEKEILIHPNPTNSFFTISSNQEFTEVRITSLEGRFVYNKKDVNDYKCNIDISNLKNGIYTLSLLTVDGTILTEKLIKN